MVLGIGVVMGAAVGASQAPSFPHESVFVYFIMRARVAGINQLDDQSLAAHKFAWAMATLQNDEPQTLFHLDEHQ